MELLERMAIERACERLIVAYTHHIDFGEAEKVADLFTEDGVWESPEVRMEGREQIRKGFGRRQQVRRRSRHVCTNLRVDAIDEENAESVVYFTLYRHDGDEDVVPAPLRGPLLIGTYRDRFRRVGDEWRFAHRTTEVGFMRRSERA